MAYDGPVDVLALYDIHGNLDALEAVLADPRASGADAVVVGGDVVPGPFAAAALARLEAIDLPVHRIRGNGEREVASATGGPPPAEDDMALVTAAITATELGEKRSLALGELPSTLAFDGVLYYAAGAGRQMLASGWPDELSVNAALVEPVEAIVVTRIFEERAAG